MPFGHYRVGLPMHGNDPDCMVDPLLSKEAAAGVGVTVWPDGYVAGTASTSSIDTMNHKVLAGAFDDSIKRKGLTGPKGVKLLAFHRWNQPAGAIKQLATTPDGKLRIGAQLNLNVSYVKDLYETIKDNGGLSFSVGFRLQDY